MYKPKYKINDLLIFYNITSGDEIVKMAEIYEIDEKGYYYYKTVYRNPRYRKGFHTGGSMEVIGGGTVLLDGSRYVRKATKLEKVLFCEV